MNRRYGPGARPFGLVALCVGVAALLSARLVTSSLAQEPSRQQGKTAAAPVLLRQLSNEYGDLAGNSYADISRFRFTELFGLLVGGDLFLDSHTDDALGTGGHTAQPGVIVAFLLTRRLIFAPSYQYNVTFAGWGDWRSISESTIDVYTVYQPSGRTWFILDTRILIDHISEDRTASVDLEAGRVLGSLLDALVSGYLRPGIGISGNRPYDWNLEVGLKVAF